MFTSKRYVPILKSKQGERQALGGISDAVKDKLVPLLEVDSVPEDRDLDHHCTLNLSPVAQTWGTERPLFLDPWLVAAESSTTGIDGAEFAFRHAASTGLTFVPVTGLRRSPLEIAAAVGHSGLGICLRVEEEDLESPTLAQDLDDFLASHGKSHDAADIVIDLSAITGERVARIRGLFRTYTTAFPNLMRWRTVTIAASAFPRNMSAAQGNGATCIDRVEWLAWLGLYQTRGDLLRLPMFGDYAIQHPELMEGYDPRFMPPSANIRYTVDNQWLILKGQSVRRVSGVTQYPALAANLMGRREFMGVGHCAGCADIQRCANGAAGMASGAPWRRIGTVHHLTHVTSQIGQLVWP